MVDMKEKAKDILEDYTYSYSQVDVETLAKTLCQIESEAIKEFAERLKSKQIVAHKSKECVCVYEFDDELIDNLVAEMVGDSDER